MENLTMNKIAKEIMYSEYKAVVTYHEDSSKKQNVVFFFVQSVIISEQFDHYQPCLLLAKVNKI